MANPFSGVLINGIYFGYVEGSYSRSYALKNSSAVTQNSKAFTVLGVDFPVHTITLNLDSTYTVYNEVTNNIAGTTTWTGVSRLASLVSTIGALGTSAIIFVAPDGSSHVVVPTGTIDPSIAYTTPKDTGIEWRVHLTLENQS